MTEQKSPAQYCENLLFLNIFKAFRIAIQPARIFIAFLALTLIFVIGWTMDLSKTVAVSGEVTRGDLISSSLTGSLNWPTELHCFIGAPDRIEGYIERYKDKPHKQGVFRVWSNFCMSRLNKAAASVVVLRFDNFAGALRECVLASIWAFKHHTIYSIIMFLIALIIFSITSGAISRGAALKFSRDENCGITPCLEFAFKKFLSLFGAPSLPIVFIIIFILLLLGVGLITNIGWIGEIFLAFPLTFIIVLVLGVCITLMIIGLGGGINLMPSVIAYEHSDAFDAFNRSCSYVYTRPWRLSFYMLIATVYGAVCYLFARFFVFLMLTAGRWFLYISIWKNAAKAEQMNKLDVIWPKPEFFSLLGSGAEIAKSRTESFAEWLINLQVLVIAGVVIAFAVSFYFSASTIIYCLLRKGIDQTPLDSVFIETEQKPEPVQSQNTEQS
ncbi:MAG: hypothetical protein JW806_05865 [Sedimentisphaerales bacterium]|nr:hypothetical protein [Sedimentisphaerales bacterium]